jgi:type VI secretion system protein ImpE
VFAGGRSRLIFGDPPPWLALLIQALGLTHQKHFEQASELRATALEQAPTAGGTLNGTAIQWIADADSRLGPVLEVLINGKYYWMPFERLTRVVIDVPADVRDLVWTPAQLTLANGGEVLALVPTRYPGSEAVDDAQIQMARRTDWQSLPGDTYLGLGQRVLTTDTIEVGLLELRELVLSSSNG